jgi:cytochrome P450
MQVNGDPAAFSSQRGGILMAHGTPEARHPLLFRASMDAMINMDAPHHLQLRREHMPYFTPRYLADLRGKVEAEVDRLLDQFGDEGGCCLVEKLSSRLPLFTLGEILGVPLEDREKFVNWMHYLELAGNLAAERQAGAMVEPTIELMQFIQAFNDNVEEMFDYGRRMLHARRAEPANDLMTAIARAQIDGELLSDEYLDGSWLLIVFAGNDTTRNTISGALKLLTEFPDQKRKLIERPELLKNAADEFIRMVSPVIYMRRTATRDTEIAGQPIGEGEKVVMYYGAANRDERVFTDPTAWTSNAPTPASTSPSATARTSAWAARRQPAAGGRLRPPAAALPGHRVDRRDRHRPQQLRPRHPQPARPLHPRATGGLVLHRRDVRPRQVHALACTSARPTSGIMTPGSVDSMRWTRIEASGFPGHDVELQVRAPRPAATGRLPIPRATGSVVSESRYSPLLLAMPLGLWQWPQLASR